MDAALIALLPAYTATVVLTCRHYWAHRCAECAYRNRVTHTPGRHRPDRVALPARPAPAILPALPAGTDPAPPGSGTDVTR
ncbi:MAG TPA: hypothetical protein VFX70_22490 [Mycobacteriales bacterium]|nr:hypothetical protein [Mycobacteriales bacterium]